jgi:hypothetical protein
MERTAQMGEMSLGVRVRKPFQFRMYFRMHVIHSPIIAICNLKTICRRQPPGRCCFGLVDIETRDHLLFGIVFRKCRWFDRPAAMQRFRPHIGPLICATVATALMGRLHRKFSQFITTTNIYFLGAIRKIQRPRRAVVVEQTDRPIDCQGIHPVFELASFIRQTRLF